MASWRAGQRRIAGCTFTRLLTLIVLTRMFPPSQCCVNENNVVISDEFKDTALAVSKRRRLVVVLF